MLKQSNTNWGITTLILASLLMAPQAWAWEVDHYTLPPGELVDIGDVITEYVYDGLIQAITELNAELEPHLAQMKQLQAQRSQGQLSNRKTRTTMRRLQAQIKQLTTKDALVDRCFSEIGGGWALSGTIGKWVKSDRLRRRYADLLDSGMVLSFRPRRDKSIYPVWVTLQRTPIYIPLSPLIKVYNVEMGIDKIGHLFKQGWQYYGAYRKALKKGKTDLQAEQAAIQKVGVRTEKTYFGLMGAGVYANADLAVNYIGLKFWKNLTDPQVINGTDYPAMLTVQADGTYALDGYYEKNRDKIFGRYVSYHYNEIFNPNYFVMFPEQVKNLMARTADVWLKRYSDISESEFIALIHELSTWYGEDYGHSKNYKELYTFTLPNLYKRKHKGSRPAPSLTDPEPKPKRAQAELAPDSRIRLSK